MGFCGFSDMLIQRCVQPRQAQTRKVLLFSWESFQSRRERLGKRKLGNFQSWFARYQNRRSMGVGRQGKFVLIFSCLSGLDNLFICACSAAQACANIAGPLRKRSASWQSRFFLGKRIFRFPLRSSNLSENFHETCLPLVRLQVWFGRCETRSEADDTRLGCCSAKSSIYSY